MTTSKPIKVVFVLGGPGSGKTTQCQKISQLYGFTHLSPCDLLLKETTLGSEYSTLIHSMMWNIMNVGKLVPPKLTLQLLRREMDKSMNYKFVVDGFPFDLENLDEWEHYLVIEPKLVLNFECSEQVLLSRREGDEDLDTMTQRLKRFLIDSPSLISYFNQNGTLEKINAETSIEEVFEQIQGIFCRKNLDLDDCILSKDFSDPWEIKAFRDQPNQPIVQQPIVQVQQPIVQVQQPILQGKRTSEDELHHPKKKRKQILGPAKRNIKQALKELGKREDISYLDGLTPEDYLKQLRDLVVLMAGRVDDLVSPVPIEKITDDLIPCDNMDNMSMVQMVELGIKEVEGTVHCSNCGYLQKSKVDWREGFLCLASNLVGRMFKPGMKPPSNPSFRVACSSCYSKASVPCLSDKGWNFLFLAFTYSVGSCPREAILGYLQEKKMEIPSEASEDILYFSFYLAVINQLDPTIDAWKYLGCSVAGAVSNGEKCLK